MNERKANQSHQRWVNGIRTATVVVVLGTIAAVWHPLDTSDANGVVSTATEAAASTADMSAYFPARFPAPENIEPQAPTF